MAATPDFLSRRDRTALRNQYRKGETPQRIVQADFDGRMGLLAVTDRRVLFVSKGALRTFVKETARDQLERVTQRTERFGSLVLKTKTGRRMEFWMQERGAAKVIAEALRPPANAPPVEFKTTSPARSPAPPPAATISAPRSEPRATQSRPAPTAQPSTVDGSSYLASNTAERRARLERQLAIGAITKAEYQWQLDSLR